MKLIDVRVIVFPNGKTCCFKYNPETEEQDIRDRLDDWKEANGEKYEGTGVNMAVTGLTMLEEDYNDVSIRPFIP